MITETETAFLAVVRAFLTEEKAALEELAALTEKQWNHLFVMAAQHSLLSAVYDVVGKTPEFAGLPGHHRLWHHLALRFLCPAQSPSS
jgi:hypothetical protein